MVSARIMLVRVAAAAGLAVLALAACGAPSGGPTDRHADNSRADRGARPGAGPEWFTDRARELGIDFVHDNGMSGHLYMPEILGPGVALFDYDNDGDLDVYVVQGELLTTATARGSEQGPVRTQAAGGRLYRNDLEVRPDGTRTLRFTDVTAQSRITARGYGMGVAAGDFNNDGWVDLYLTKFGAPNQLWRNNGNGTFTDVSKESGTDVAGWSVSAAFVDVDRDGWLDLYVGNYLRYSLDANAHCFSPSGTPDYCTPGTYQPLPDRLYRNLGNGRFADITASSGIGSEFGPALGVSTADFNGDGWMDIYVANDGRENQLWLNQKNLTFKNTALAAGVALPVDGKAEASMGVDAGDFDNDGDEDLFMTELTGEGSNLYVNDGTGIFEDRSVSSGVGPSSLTYTGFGTAWLDFDNDGRLDVLSVNGTVQIIQALAQAHDPFPLHQRKLLLRNAGNGRLEDVTDQAGRVFELSEVGRGAAFGDIDNDGDVDVIIGNNNGPVRLLVNNVGNRRHWVGLRLVSGAHARDMLGARVEIARKDGTRLWRRVRADGSYASANDPRVLIGLGDSADPVDVRVRWPDGRGEEWRTVHADRYTMLQEGTGDAIRTAKR
jgi:hypothetical protein